MVNGLSEFILGKPHRDSGDGSHVITMCPFCEKPDHAYINKETGAWDCKRCGEKGGLKRLLDAAGIQYEEKDYTKEALNNHGNLALVPELVDYLEHERGLNGAIKKFKIGFAMKEGRISIPYWKNGKCVQIRYRAIKGAEPKYLSTQGSKTMLYNQDDLFDLTRKYCLLTEGELDAALTSMRMGPEWAVIGVPGSTSFKPEWGRYFNRFQRVLICFDNDPAGEAGARKIKQHIPNAEIVKFPKGFPVKYDLGDYWNSEKDDLPKLTDMIESEVAGLLPPSGFIRDYVDYCRPLTDAPEVFHLFTALGLLSAAIGRKAYCRSFGGHSLYPNLWIVLLAKSSYYRKTTSLNIGKQLLNDIQSITVHPSEFSREALQEMIARNPQGVFVWYEFGAILSMLTRDYMAGTKDFLSDLYDCLDKYTRMTKKETFTISDAYITVMSATNVDWLQRGIKGEDIRGGFLARFLYVPVDKKDRFMAIPGEPDQELRFLITEELNRISTKLTSRRYYINNLKDAFTDFARSSEQEIIGTKHEVILAPFFSRLEAYLWKFAMLYEISMQSDSEEISTEAFYWAVEVVNWLKVKLKLVIGEDLDQDRNPKMKRVQDQIKKSAGITMREILRNTGIVKPELSMYLQTLEASGEVTQRKDGKTIKYFWNP